MHSLELHVYKWNTIGSRYVVLCHKFPELFGVVIPVPNVFYWLQFFIL